MNTQHHSGGIKGIYLYLSQEITAVHQRETHGLTLIFISIRTLQNQERIVGMAGLAPHTANGLNALTQMSSFLMSFPSPPARELHHIIVIIWQIQIEAHGLGKVDYFLTGILEISISGNGIKISKNCIGQNQLHAVLDIHELHQQGFCFLILFHIGSRQSLQLWLARNNLMGHIAEIRKPAAILLQYLHSSLTEICSSIGWIFLLYLLQ